MKIPSNKKRSITLIVLFAASIFVLTFLLVGSHFKVWPFNNHKADGIGNHNNSEVQYNGEKSSPPIEINNTQNNENTAGTTTTTVNVALVSASVIDNSLDIRAFVPGTIEGDGYCTAIVTNGDVEVKEKTPAFIDSTTSQCEPIILPLERFSQKGTWTVKVEYSSPSHKGISELLEIQI